MLKDLYGLCINVLIKISTTIWFKRNILGNECSNVIMWFLDVDVDVNFILEMDWTYLIKKTCGWFDNYVEVTVY